MKAHADAAPSFIYQRLPRRSASPMVTMRQRDNRHEDPFVPGQRGLENLLLHLVNKTAVLGFDLIRGGWAGEN